MIHEPAPATLAKYGLTLEDWYAFIPDDCCPICEQEFERYVVDHQHVLGWKKMAPEERRRYARGVVCRTCNHFILTRYGTPLKHRNAAKYLERYEKRKPK